MLFAFSGCSANDAKTPQERRAAELRALIDKNLEAGGHAPLSIVVTKNTVDKVSQEVTDRDVAPLVLLLADEKTTTRIAAQHLLERFGNQSLRAIDSALRTETRPERLRFLKSARRELEWKFADDAAAATR